MKHKRKICPFRMSYSHNLRFCVREECQAWVRISGKGVCSMLVRIHANIEPWMIDSEPITDEPITDDGL